MTDLLGRGAPHTCQVQNRVLSKTSGGVKTFVPSGDPITVHGAAEPVRDWASAEESRELGLQVLNLILWRSKQWPGDIDSHVIFDGSLYETVGAPQHFSKSKRTAHWRVTLRWLQKVD